MPNTQQPPDIGNDDKPASTYFEWQRRSINNPEKKGEGGDVSSLPAMPASSPWAADPVPPEPLIDRSAEDGDVMGVAIDQLNR
jgi:hypothetical protein